MTSFNTFIYNIARRSVSQLETVNLETSFSVQVRILSIYANK